MNIKSFLSQGLRKLPPYLFVEIDKKKKAAQGRGVDVISLGVGDPNDPTPIHIVRAGQEALANPQYHHYPFGSGLSAFREAISRWYKQRFNVSLDPAAEILALIGSKEGLGHLPLALVDTGNVVLVPDPGYPVYYNATLLAGGKPYRLPLLEKNGFLPDLESIPPDVLESAKLLYLNYPNNPTSAIASKEFFSKVVEFAAKNSILVAHDAPYTEVYFGEPPISFLSVPGAKEVGIEFHSCSKTYQMTGWRAGWACGNPELLKGLAAVKDNYDSGVFEAIQAAATRALSGPQDCVEEMRKIYRERRDLFCDGLKKLGWRLAPPQATFYVWTKPPKNISSVETTGKLLDEAGVVCTPGNGFGPSGEGYVRFALTTPKERLSEALLRLGKLTW
jgi:LL-diaminopimelate aminotransferase